MIPARTPNSAAFHEILIGSGAMVSLLGLGTCGYVILEGWSVLDAFYMTFYMTFITVTTIGFAEVEL